MDLTAVIRASGFGLLSDFGPSGFGFRETGIVIQTQSQWSTLLRFPAFFQTL
jgi:hypothetical protein